MFYLKQFFKISLRYPVKSTLFFISTLILTSVILYGGIFKVWFWDHFGKVPFYPSFYALFVTDEDSDYIRTKLLNLPSVIKVDYKRKEEVKDKILNNLSEMGVPKEFASFDFNILRIYLDGKISDKSVSLMKEYLQRLVKDKNIVFTALEKESSYEKIYKNDFMLYLKNLGILPLWVVSFVLWFLSFFLILPEIRKFSYLIENFQRRTWVASKIFFTGTITISMSVLLSFSLFLKNVDFNFAIVAVFYFFISFLINRIKYDFSERI